MADESRADRWKRVSMGGNPFDSGTNMPEVKSTMVKMSQEALQLEKLFVTMPCPPPPKMSDLKAHGYNPTSRPFKYDPSLVVSNFFKWNGTVFPIIVRRSDFHFFIVVGIAAIAAGQIMEDSWAYEFFHLPFTTVGVVTALCTFFIVFFTSQCFTRYFGLYDDAWQMGGKVMECIGVVWVDLAHVPLAVRWNICRYVLAAYHIALYGAAGGSVNDQEWEVICERRLLTKGEVKIIKAYNGKVALSKAWIVLQLALKLFRDACSEKDGEKVQAAKAFTYNHLRELMQQIRGKAASIANTMACPIPFAYFHAMLLLCYADFLLLAWSMALLGSWFSLLAYIIFLVSIMALREVSVALADPFGDDDTDFDVDVFLVGQTKNAIANFEFDTAEMIEAVYADQGYKNGPEGENAGSLKHSASTRVFTECATEGEEEARAAVDVTAAPKPS